MSRVVVNLRQPQEARASLTGPLEEQCRSSPTLSLTPSEPKPTTLVVQLLLLSCIFARCSFRTQGYLERTVPTLPGRLISIQASLPVLPRQQCNYCLQSSPSASASA